MITFSHRLVGLMLEVRISDHWVGIRDLSYPDRHVIYVQILKGDSREMSIDCIIVAERVRHSRLCVRYCRCLTM